jgi:hypothetical protein
MRTQFVKDLAIQYVPNIKRDSILKKYLRVILAFSWLFFSANAFGGSVAAVVYFVPFEIETYVPITRSTITCDAREKWTISEGFHTSQLTNLLIPSDYATFDTKRVRVRIDFGKQIYYIDATGTAQKGSLNFKTDKIAFLRFANSLTLNQRQIIKRRPCKN